MSPAARSRSLAGFAAALLLAVQGAGQGMAWAAVGGADRAATALCANARATLQLTGFHADEHGRFEATGTWQTSGSGVYFEFRVDGDRYGAETQQGSVGRWRYADAFAECEPHTARAHVFPMVTVGGRDIACLDQDQSVAHNFETDCRAAVEITSCVWRCQPGQAAVCTGTCTARASGDPIGYAAFWGINDGGYTPGEGDNRGPWTRSVTCCPGQRVSFKVRDHAGAGAWSKVVEAVCGKP